MEHLYLCYRCGSSKLTLRGEYFGCNDCGLWTERKRYGSEALRPLQQHNRHLAPQTHLQKPTTTSSSDEILISDDSARRLLTRREKARKAKTFRDPRGP